MRKIDLQPWQRTIVMGNPGHFARGLFHSDGYRGVNRVRAHLAEGDHWYEYPRYLFTNESKDILRLWPVVVAAFVFGIAVGILLSRIPRLGAWLRR
jgi:hypothetical protein